MVKNVRLIVDQDQDNLKCVCACRSVGMHMRVLLWVCGEKVRERELGVPYALVHLVPTSYSLFTVNNETTFCQSSRRPEMSMEFREQFFICVGTVVFVYYGVKLLIFSRMLFPKLCFPLPNAFMTSMGEWAGEYVCVCVCVCFCLCLSVYVYVC